jgi:hypothetical protein
MLAEHFRTAAAGARTTASLDETARLLWRAHAEAQIPDTDAGAISPRDLRPSPPGIPFRISTFPHFDDKAATPRRGFPLAVASSRTFSHRHDPIMSRLARL